MVLSEISEAKSELESEGMNSDEATELIQKIFSEIHSPKYKNNSNFFFGKKSHENSSNSGIRKTWSEALANMNQIMQVIHTNNYQFHQYCRKTKVYNNDLFGFQPKIQNRTCLVLDFRVWF